jgi:hypothetical protein
MRQRLETFDRDPGIVTSKVTRRETLSIPRAATGQLRFPLSQLNLQDWERAISLIADFLAAKWPLKISLKT